ncbi:site-2 protease family protein [Gordonia sp. PDNC005]|uniref:site-2 protease family protein n=1 Tax=unclassified Gordonia (in: high G+C Gram-positive bacteria) TaxID=2657482 RepID=UPI0019653766|nr:site-2 protease family protein [Gordonia sp. PDNC005]QRY61933.1 site-2 protease family protein [Gordonia sp. PDNC005]
MTTPTAAALKSVRPGPVFLGLCAAFGLGVYLLIDSGEDDSATAAVGAVLLVLSGWVISLSLHEFAHAFTAFRFGDRSAELRGYLTLNPLKYTHPAMSIGFPLLIIALGGIGFPGGAVYVNEAGFTPEQRTKVSLAGPAANLLIGLVLCAVLVGLAPGDDLAGLNLYSALALLAFLQFTAVLLNMLPVPGLDGFGAIEPYLSHETRRSVAKVAPFGFLIVFVLLYIPVLNRTFFNIVYTVMDTFGIDSPFISYGWALFEFWR